MQVQCTPTFDHQCCTTAIIRAILFDYCITGPKLRFPYIIDTLDMSCLPKHEFSYSLAEDRAEFCKINEMCRKFCPILHEIHSYV